MCVRGEEPSHFQSNFQLGEPLRRLVGTDEVARRLGQAGQTLVDARAAPGSAAKSNRSTRWPATFPAR
jgi:hypothetical protein